MIPGTHKRRRYVTADALEAYAFTHPGAVIVMTRTEATVRVGGLELVAPLATADEVGTA